MRVGSPRTSQQTRFGLSLGSSNFFSGDRSITRVGSPRTSQQTQTRLGLSLSSSNFLAYCTLRNGTLRNETKRNEICTLRNENLYFAK